MNIDRIKFTKEFVYHGVREWIGLEATITMEENEMACLLELRQKTIDTFNASIKHTTIEMQPAEPNILPVVEGKRTTGMKYWENQINEAQNLEALEGLRTIADSNPKLKTVFNERLKILQDGK